MAASLVILMSGTNDKMNIKIMTYVYIFFICLQFVVDRFGRRNTAMSVITLVGLSGILVNLVHNTIASTVLFIIFQMGLIVMGMYTAITVALFPTHLR